MGEEITITLGPHGAVELVDSERRFGISISASDAAIVGRTLLTAAAIQAAGLGEKLIGIPLDQERVKTLGLGLLGWEIRQDHHSDGIVLILRAAGPSELWFAMDGANAKAMAAQLALLASAPPPQSTRVQ